MTYTTYKFNHPINVKELRSDPYFDEWGPLRGSFQRSSFKISIEYWNMLNQLAAKKNPGYLDFIERIQKEPLAEGIRLEKELEDALAANLKILKKFGYDLELYVDPVSKQSGRQFICRGNGGHIDLLCHDEKQDRYVVIELKNVRAGQNTFGQISNYMGWVQNRIARDVPVNGLVISRGYDTKFESALRITDKIKHLNVEDLGFPIAPSKKEQEFTEPKQNDSSRDASKLSIKRTKSREAHTWLTKGDKFFDKAEYTEAISCYEKAIEIDPKNVRGWISKGVALDELTKHEDAIKCYDRIIEIYPKLTRAWNNKGWSLIELNRFEDALVAFENAIRIKPNSADAWNGKGVVLNNLEKYEDAINNYDKAIEISPRFATAWNNKGWSLIDLDKHEEAIQCFNKAIKLDGKLILAWAGNGLALTELGKYEEAIKSYDKAIGLDPKFSWALDGIGYALLKLGKYEDSIECSNKAIELDPQNAYVWLHKGMALDRLGKYNDAISVYDKAIEIDPQLADAWYNKSRVLEKLGRDTEAMTALTKAKELGYTDSS